MLFCNGNKYRGVMGAIILSKSTFCSLKQQVVVYEIFLTEKWIIKIGYLV